jgi:thioredoxin reductase (NADPH)
MDQAKSFGARFDYQTVMDVDFSKHPILIQTNHSKILTESLIIATGASPRKLGIPGENEGWGKGVTSCATCDGFFFKKMDIAVIGGGDSAAEEALFLTKFATKVFLIHRRDTFRASKIMFKRVMENPKIQLIVNTVVDEVLQSTTPGEAKLSGLKIRNILTNETKILAVKGLFVCFEM